MNTVALYLIFGLCGLMGLFYIWFFWLCFRAFLYHCIPDADDALDNAWENIRRIVTAPVTVTGILNWVESRLPTKLKPYHTDVTAGFILTFLIVVTIYFL